MYSPSTVGGPLAGTQQIKTLYSHPFTFLHLLNSDIFGETGIHSDLHGEVQIIFHFCVHGLLLSIPYKFGSSFRILDCEKTIVT